ncbi:MAG: glutamate formimidoyltransferase [Methanobacteriota archaeon]|nr:MAG: glutamate formimidoyltransferase [Euryarchaeota archaeon]
MAVTVECVPNFSEGRDRDVVDRIAHSIRSVPGTKILDVEMDADHNRSVITFVGNKNSVQEGAFRGARAAAELIDLTKHKGEHPRMGALDVLPFVPIQGATMQDCVEIASKVGERIARQLKIPVFLYEEAARRPERKRLEDVRKGQFEGLREAISSDDSRFPDFGPRNVHPTAGAVAVGARMPLIAFNINLRSEDLSAAKDIARKIRTSGGGLKHLKALGFDLKEKGMVQVSMNLTDYTVTPISRVFDEVTKEAGARGIEVAEGEIIGLIPLDAVCDITARYLRLEQFSSNQILERRIWR